MSNIPWNENDVDRVRHMADAGHSASEIAAEFPGTTRNAVIGLCHRRGIQLHQRAKVLSLKGAKLDKARLLAGKGRSAEEIASRFGVPRRTVLRSLRKSGTAIKTLAPRPVPSPMPPKRSASGRSVVGLPVLPEDSTRAFSAKVLTIKQLDQVAAEKARLRIERDRILSEAFRPTALARPVVAASGCRWPLWSADATLSEKLVCGHPKEPGASYCQVHAALAYQPPENRRAA